MVLGADVSIGHDEGHPVNAISAADLTMAFRYVRPPPPPPPAGAALFLALMEEHRSPAAAKTARWRWPSSAAREVVIRPPLRMHAEFRH